VFDYLSSFISLFTTVVNSDMSEFNINLNSEMKEESYVAILDSDWFAVALGDVFFGVMGWRGCEFRFGKDLVSLILGGFG